MGHNDGPRLPPGCLAQDPGSSVEMPNSMRVQEVLCVLVPCSFSCPGSGSGPVSGYWFRAGANTDHDSPVANTTLLGECRRRPRADSSEVLGDPGTNNCSLMACDSDSGLYFFQMEKGRFKWSYCANQVSVHVTDRALTHTPDILVPGALESCHPSNLTCSVPWACEQGTPPTFSWVGPTLSSLGPNIIHSLVLILTPWPQDHGTNFTCQVKFPLAGVTTEKTIQLNVTCE
ncbi:myeloid cell surface antigen CD33-like [Callospermophilus lateralis]|uniref:myeloid cell surface antigen CD33-like n=1 Tax=Callospermophilus lateralis TaxID=76772 RepID=UPI004038EB27